MPRLGHLLQRSAAAAALAISLCAIALPAGAVQPGEVLADPVLEARAREISSGLRCLVCQNQSIDDSDATLARDLRLIVRERLLAGDSDEQVREFVVGRYGDFVLLKPPFKLSTLLLWLGPLLVLLAGAAGIVAARRNSLSGAAGNRLVELTPDEKARLEAILDERRSGGN